MSAKKTRRPSSPRRFFARLYGHLEATKKTEDDEDEDHARESLDSSPEITEKSSHELPDSSESHKMLPVSTNRSFVLIYTQKSIILSLERKVITRLIFFLLSYGYF